MYHWEVPCPVKSGMVLPFFNLEERKIRWWFYQDTAGASSEEQRLPVHEDC